MSTPDVCPLATYTELSLSSLYCLWLIISFEKLLLAMFLSDGSMGLVTVRCPHVVGGGGRGYHKFATPARTNPVRPARLI